MLKAVTSAAQKVRARRLGQKIESLEDRRMLSVSMNSAGWTVVTPAAGARVIYCSSTGGSDSNNGLSPQSPVKTIAVGEALLRNNTGDQLLLKAGDVFYNNFIFWTLSGQSAANPMVLGSYGTGARPEIMTGTQDGLKTGKVSSPTVNYLDIMGINFHADGRDPNMTKTPATGSNPSGIDILTKSTGILVENCEFQYYTVGLTFQDYLGPLSDVTVRRNVIIDSYSGNTHAQGMYATGVTNLTIDDNLFDQNGYNTQLGILPTVFNQDCYLSYDNVNCVVENNIFSRAASTGLEDRPGGIVKDNVFINDPVGMTFGLVNGAMTTKGGVTGQVTGNVFMGGGNIGNLPEGEALLLGNIKAGAGAVVSGNVFSQGGANSCPAITLEMGKAQIDPQDSVGINDLTITSNTFYDWSTGIDVVANLTAGGSGISAFNRVSITNNKFENLTGPSMENHSATYLAQEKFSGNTYYNSGQWVVNSVRSTTQGTTLTAPFAFPDPGRTTAGYDKALGNSGTLADFLTRAAARSAQNWNVAYGGAALESYLVAGFGAASGSSGSTGGGADSTPPPPTGTSQSATATIAAVNYAAKSGIVPDGYGGIGSNGGNWVEYSQVNFGTGVTTFTASVAGLAQYVGSVQIRLDSPTGTLVGTLKIAGTGAWNKYVAQSTAVKGATGVHNLYLVFVGGGGTGNVQSFSFSAATTTTTTPPPATTRAATTTLSAVSYNAKSGIVPDGYGGIGSNGGNWVEYSQIDFGTGATTFTANVAGLAQYVGSVQIRLDSPTGTLVGTLKIAGTGAWNKYVAQSTAVKGATGVHNLYLVFVGGGGTGNVQSFHFSTTATTVTTRAAKTAINAINYNAMSGILPDGYGGIGANGGAWAEYSQVDFGTGITKFVASVAGLSKYVGSIQIRLDSPTGALVGTLKIAGTSAWNSYVPQTAAISGATGVHNVYLVFVGGGGVGNVKSFNFA